MSATFHTSGFPASEEEFEVIAHLLQRGKQKLPAPSFSLAPIVPLPLWQCVVFSALQTANYNEEEVRQSRTQRKKLAKELARYHNDVRAREEQQLRQQRESRARIGEKLVQSVQRLWSRRGDGFQELLKIEFDMVKHLRDKRKQEDLLRETEELSKRLIESILMHGKGIPGEDPASSNDGGGPHIESSLSLLDTQGGKRPLRHYQRSALQWMVHLYRNKLSGVLADEMGLGKTVQAIALLCYFAEMHNDWGPHLVVVPTTVVLNWKAEFERWAPGLKVLTYIGSVKERHHLRKGWTSEDAFHVCVTSYNLVLQDRAVFRRRPWGFLILDEAHQVKNFMSKKWQALFDLQTEYRLLLTGTPLQNSIMELWSLFHFLLPFASAFRSNDDFREWFSNPMDEMITGRTSLNEDIIRRLQAILRPFMLRRLKKDVETQLPSKTEKVVLCRLSRRQRSLYDDYIQLSETKQRIRYGGAGAILSVLLALRKVCNHPDMFEERPTVSPLVLDYFAEIQLNVPRRILLKDNDFRGRFRFPRSVQVWDLNDGEINPTRSSDLQSGVEACFAWLPCSYVNVPFVFDSADDAINVERFSPRHFPHEHFNHLSTSTRGALLVAKDSGPPPATENSSLQQVDLDLVFASLKNAATVLFNSMVERQRRTVRFQSLRYAEAVSRVVFRVPRLCELRRTLKDVILQKHYEALCPTIAQRAAAIIPMVEQVAVFVPPVLAARPPGLHWRLPISRPAAFERVGREACAGLIGYVRQFQDRMREGREWTQQVYDGSFFLSEMWPIHIRRCFSFPDRRLIIHDSGKLQFLAVSLKELRQEGHRMLIFTQFVHMLNILERFLGMVGIAYLRLDGSTHVERRQEIVDRFNTDARLTCMILSTRSGGIGLNLTGADTVIFYDSDWNPTMDLQAQDRCHRIGQTKPVTIYRLISEHTIEESILQKARERKKLNNVVIRGGQFHAIVDVTEDYDDSAAAFAALSDPVNLRHFFHDLDEDATVPVERLRSAQPTPSALQSISKPDLSAEDILREMGKVEDAEDQEAQVQLEQELRQRRVDEAADAGDQEEDGGERVRNGISGEDATAFYDPSEQDNLLRSFLPANAEGEEGLRENASYSGSSLLREPHLQRALRKRCREVLSKTARTPLDKFLTLRYGECCEDDARARYVGLCDTYSDQLGDVNNEEELPRFRSRFAL